MAHVTCPGIILLAVWLIHEYTGARLMVLVSGRKWGSFFSGFCEIACSVAESSKLCKQTSRIVYEGNLMTQLGFSDPSV